MAFPDSVVAEAWKQSGGTCECQRSTCGYVGCCGVRLVWGARAFKEGNLRYPFFERIAGQVWSKAEPLRFPGLPFSGLTVFPGRSPLVQLVEEFEKARAPATGIGAPG